MKPLIIAAALLALPAAAAAQTNEVRADASANGRTITVRSGQYLTVSVNACVGCPYGWRLTRLPTNMSLSGIQNIDTNDRSGDEPVVGGSKTVEYTFLVEGNGRGTLRLENRRFQGPRDRNTQTLTINVVTR